MDPNSPIVTYGIIGFLAAITGVSFFLGGWMKNNFWLLYIGVIALMIGIFMVANARPTSNDKMYDELSNKYNLELDKLNYIDNARVFIFSGTYYIRTDNDVIIQLDQFDARSAYEKK